MYSYKLNGYVLILVLMEDALALLSNFQIKEVTGGVLFLVLMEDALSHIREYMG